MKRLIILGLFVITVGCSKSNVTKYTSLNGTWKFSNENASGQFDITTTSGTRYVTPSSTSFLTVKGTKKSIIKAQITGTTTNPVMELTDGAGLSVSFYTTQCNSDYASISVSGWYYFISTDNSPVTQAPTTITRVK